MAKNSISGVLMLRCDATGEPIYTGIWFRPNQLDQLKPERIFVVGPSCAQQHHFDFSAAWLTRPS